MVWCEQPASECPAVLVEDAISNGEKTQVTAHEIMMRGSNDKQLANIKSKDKTNPGRDVW